MRSFLNDYGTAEGPLGFPLTDRQAIALDSILKALPKDEAFRYRKAIVPKATTEVLSGERSDVSWITTEDPDRMGDVVLARGMNDSQFRQNPIVTLNHAYWVPPVGRSLWRKYATDGRVKGVKAKTQYPARPGDWPPSKDWPADIAFALVQADLLRGKSIGFLPTKVHTPSSDESKLPGWEKVGVVIDEWILLEYACVFLPANQNTVLETVSGKQSAVSGQQSAIRIPPEFQKALGVELEAHQLAFKGAVPFEATEKANKDRAWDGDAARSRLDKWAEGDLSKYQRGFAYVADEGKDKGDYKLPHHDIVDGKLLVVFAGVKAAMAALHGARGGIDAGSAKKAVHRHLAEHYQQFGEEPPELKCGVRSAERGTNAALHTPQSALDEVPFTPLTVYQRALEASLARIEPAAIAARIIEQRLDKMRGRV
jgi:hypothetical protein